jgi:hypothetical protein
MTTLQDGFELNNQDAVAKVLSGEVILLNLTSGMYFSMDGVGTTIWQLLERGHSPEQVAGAVSEQHDVTRERVTADVLRITEELVDAGLIVPTDRPAPALDESPAAEDLRYEEPRLNTYGDMSDLLALDPPMPGIIDTPWTDPIRSDETSGRG